jgi:hypothetical protein
MRLEALCRPFKRCSKKTIGGPKENNTETPTKSIVNTAKRITEKNKISARKKNTAISQRKSAITGTNTVIRKGTMTVTPININMAIVYSWANLTISGGRINSTNIEPI